MVLFLCNAVLIAKPIRVESTQIFSAAALAFSGGFLIKPFRSDLPIYSMIDNLLTFLASSGSPQVMAPRMLDLNLSSKIHFSPMHVARQTKTLKTWRGSGRMQRSWSRVVVLLLAPGKGLRVREAHSVLPLRASPFSRSTTHCFSLDDTWHASLRGVR